MLTRVSLVLLASVCVWSYDYDRWSNQVSVLSEGLCRYGNSVECCWGWRQVEWGRCQPHCQQGCKHGECVGPDRCKCHQGYTGKACNQDLNECGVKPRLCKHRCMNTLGSYKCYCQDGYTQQADGSCRNARTCFHANCQYGCEVVKGAVRCTCPSPGIRLGPDRRTCIDIDECASPGVGVCPRGRKCVNSFGSFTCRCHFGFKLTYINGRYNCIDKDTRSFCSLNPASPKCRCKDGRCKAVPRVTVEPHRPRTTSPAPAKTTTPIPTTLTPSSSSVIKTTPFPSTIRTTAAPLPTTTELTTSRTTPRTTIKTQIRTTSPIKTTVTTSSSTTTINTTPRTIATSSSTLSTTELDTLPPSTTSPTLRTTIPITIKTTTPTTTTFSTALTTINTPIPSTIATSSSTLSTTELDTLPPSTARPSTQNPTTIRTTIPITIKTTTPIKTTFTTAINTTPSTVATSSSTLSETEVDSTTLKTTIGPPVETTTLNNRINNEVTHRQRGDVHIPRHPGQNHVWEFDIELGNTALESRDDPAAGSLHCSFDRGLCDWMSDREGDIHWQTSHSPTGGRYLSVPELKAGQRSVRGARLVVNIPPPWSHGDLCVSFSHWLTGNHVGVMQLYVKRKGQRFGSALWSRTAGHGWRHTQVTITTPSVDKILLRAERRIGRRGQIAVDDVTLRRGACR